MFIRFGRLVDFDNDARNAKFLAFLFDERRIEFLRITELSAQDNNALSIEIFHHVDDLVDMGLLGIERDAVAGNCAPRGIHARDNHAAETVLRLRFSCERVIKLSHEF